MWSSATEALELLPLDGASAERFGHALAELHRSGAPSFGLDRDNFVGLTEQRDTPHPCWPDFYRDERILVIARRCPLDTATRALVDRVAERSWETPSRPHAFTAISGPETRARTAMARLASSTPLSRVAHVSSTSR